MDNAGLLLSAADESVPVSSAYN